MTYEMGKAMNWQQFKMLPSDIKREYIINYGSKNRLTQKAFAEQFGVSTVTLGSHLKAIGVNIDWREIASGRLAESDNAVVADVPEHMEEERPVPSVEKKVSDAVMQEMGVIRYSGSVSMSGRSNAVFETIYKMVGDGHIKVNVTWEYE